MMFVVTTADNRNQLYVHSDGRIQVDLFDLDRGPVYAENPTLEVFSYIVESRLKDEGCIFAYIRNPGLMAMVYQAWWKVDQDVKCSNLPQPRTSFYHPMSARREGGVLSFTIQIEPRRYDRWLPN